MSVNKVMLLGRVGNDIDLRFTPSGACVANVSLATKDTWLDKSGARQERTEWHAVVVWGKSAEYVKNYSGKGQQLYVEGSLQTREYQDKQNVTKYKTEIKADRVECIGTFTQEERPQTMARPDNAQIAPVGVSVAGGPEANFDEDSIPF